MTVSLLFIKVGLTSLTALILMLLHQVSTYERRDNVPAFYSALLDTALTMVVISFIVVSQIKIWG